MLQQLHLPFPPAQGGLGRKASTNSGCGFHFSIFFFFAISTVPDQATHCLMTLITIFVVVYLSPGHHGSDRRANFQNPHCKENIWPATAKCGTSSPPCEFCHLNPAVPLHVRRPVLSHHPQPFIPPPPLPSSPTHLMWHFVARAEAAVSTVILIFKQRYVQKKINSKRNYSR